MITTILHTLHLLAVVFWIGGVGYTLFVLIPALPTVSLRDRAVLVPRLFRRFLTLVWLSIAVVASTGLYRAVAVMGISSINSLTGTYYGNILLLKLVLVAALIAVALSVTVRVYPRTVSHLKTHQNDQPTEYRCSKCGDVTGFIKAHLTAAVLLSVFIIFAAALLRGA